MNANRNGFVDAINQLNRILDVGQEVHIEVLEEAANYFVEKLRPEIPIGDGTLHLRDQLKVTVKGNRVQVEFGKKAWYWSLADKGHAKAGGKGRVNGAHFVRKTIDRERANIEAMMVRNIINRMGE